MSVEKQKTLIFGVNGQVGSELRRILTDSEQFIFCGRNDCDFTDSKSIKKIIERVKPSTIVNCAAFTNVDLAQKEKTLASKINTDAVYIIGKKAVEVDAKVIHFSTDYVFDGNKLAPYCEDDIPCPINHYGHTKLQGELALISTGAAATIIRTSWVFGRLNRCFPSAIINAAQKNKKLAVVDDQMGAPTSSRSLAHAVWSITNQPNFVSREKSSQGIFHLSGNEFMSRFEFATKIIAIAKSHGVLERCLGNDIQPIKSFSLRNPAPRPKNSCLNSKRFASAFGVALSDLSDEFRLLMESFVKNEK